MNHLPMRPTHCLLLFLPIVLAALLPASCDAGQTPGGALWTASGSGTREVILFDLSGDAKKRWALLPDEPWPESVADDGSRVAVAGKRPSRGDEPGPSRRERTVSFEYRGPAGDLRALRAVVYWDRIEPAAFGKSVYFVRWLEDDLALFRQDAAGEPVVLARTNRRRLARAAGFVSQGVLHTSAAGVVVELLGAFRPAYLTSHGSLVVDLEGAPRLYRVVFPSRLGVTRVDSTCVNDLGSFCQEIGTIEAISPAGSLASDVPIGPFDQVFPLHDGSFVRLDHGLLAVHDSVGRLRSAAPFGGGERSKQDAARRCELVERIRGAAGRASGRDWVDLALVCRSDGSYFDVASRLDPEGALERLSQIPDGDPREDEAGALLQRVAPPSVELLKRVGAPRWMRQTVAMGLLNRLGAGAPPEARAESVEAVVGDRSLDLFGCACAECVSEADVERLLASDLRRISRLAAERPDLVCAVLRGEGGERGWLETLVAGEPQDRIREAESSLRFHVDGALHAREVLSCVAGGGPAHVAAAVSTLGEPWMRRRMERLMAGPDEPLRSLDIDGWSEGEAIRAALIEASAARSDPAVQAVVSLLTPFYGIAIDPDRWRSFVAPGIDLESLAIGALLNDRSLQDVEWSRLVKESLSAARARSRDPGACDLASLWDFSNRGQDAYCRILARLQSEAATGEGPRAGDLDRLSREAGVPVELALAASIGRLHGGRASEEDSLQVWSHRALPWRVRRAVFIDTIPSEGLVDRMALDLSGGALPPSEAAETLEWVTAIRPGQASRLAADALEGGEILPFAGASDARAWLRALEPSSIGAGAQIDGMLRALLADEVAGLEAASVLAQRGDPEALAVLVDAVRTGLIDSLAKRERAHASGWSEFDPDPIGTTGRVIAELFCGYGRDGVRALETAAADLPESRAKKAVLEALREISPAAAIPRPAAPRLPSSPGEETTGRSRPSPGPGS